MERFCRVETDLTKFLEVDMELFLEDAIRTGGYSTFSKEVVIKVPSADIVPTEGIRDSEDQFHLNYDIVSWVFDPRDADIIKQLTFFCMKRHYILASTIIGEEGEESMSNLIFRDSLGFSHSPDEVEITKKIKPGEAFSLALLTSHARPKGDLLEKLPMVILLHTPATMTLVRKLHGEG